MRRKALVLTAALGLLGLPGLANAVPAGPLRRQPAFRHRPGCCRCATAAVPGGMPCQGRTDGGAGTRNVCRSTVPILVPGPARMEVRVRGMVRTGVPVGVITTASRTQPTGYAGRQ